MRNDLQLKEMGAQDCALDTRRVAIVAKQYLRDHGAGHLLEENGGPFKAGATWCQGLLKSEGLAKRKCTTQAAKLPDDWEMQSKRLTGQV